MLFEQSRFGIKKVILASLEVFLGRLGAILGPLRPNLGRFWCPRGSKRAQEVKTVQCSKGTMVQRVERVQGVLVFQLGSWMRKCPGVWQEYIFQEAHGAKKKTNRTNKGAIGGNKVREMVVFPSVGGSKKWYF